MHRTFFSVHGDEDDNDDEIFFVVWLTNKKRLAFFPAGTTVRDPHHGESPTRRQQDLNLRRTRVKALLNEVVQKCISKCRSVMF